MANAFATAGKKALLDGIVGHTFKAALYTVTAALDQTIGAYSATNELATSGGYTAGGIALTSPATGSGNNVGGIGTAWISFANATWTVSTFTGARYMLIYDTSDSNRAYAVIDFGADKAAQGGSFIFVMPTADANNAIIRI